jgi:hypothetical protein
VLARYLRLPRLLPPLKKLGIDESSLLNLFASLWRVEETGFQNDEERCAALLTPVPRFTYRIGLPKNRHLARGLHAAKYECSGLGNMGSVIAPNNW